MDIDIISGTAHPELATAVAMHLGRTLTPTEIKRFADDEIDVQITSNVRERHVFIVQPTPPPAEHWIELFLLIDAVKRASAARITVVMPYMGYARQDRKDKPRKPISAARMPKLLIACGADRLLTIDLHASQTQGAIDEPFDNLYFTAPLLRMLGPRNWRDTVLVSPDAGGVGRTRAIAKRFDNSPVAFIDKRRDRANESEVMHLVGEVEGRDTVLVDDMVDTAGSLVHAAEALRKAGARSVAACCTHPLFSPKSLDRLAATTSLDTLVVSDTTKIPDEKRQRIGSKLRIASCAPMLANAILRIASGESLSVLFDEALDDLAGTAS